MNREVEKMRYESLAFAVAVYAINDYVDLCKKYYSAKSRETKQDIESKMLLIERECEESPIISYCFTKFTPTQLLHRIRDKIKYGEKVYQVRTDYATINEGRVRPL